MAPDSWLENLPSGVPQTPPLAHDLCAFQVRGVDSWGSMPVVLTSIITQTKCYVNQFGFSVKTKRILGLWKQMLWKGSLNWKNENLKWKLKMFLHWGGQTPKNNWKTMVRRLDEFCIHYLVSAFQLLSSVKWKLEIIEPCKKEKNNSRSMWRNFSQQTSSQRKSLDPTIKVWPLKWDICILILNSSINTDR